MTTETTTLEIVAPVPPALDLFSAHAAAIKRRDELLTKARKGNAIKSAESAKLCAEFIKELATFNRGIESTRVAITAPILAQQRAINAIAKDLTADLEVEQRRIQGILGYWTAEQERIATEARQKAWEEQERVRLENERKEREAREAADRVRREKEEAERKEREAREHAAREEQQRLLDKANAAKSEAAKAKRNAELEAARINAEADAKAAEEKAAKDRHEAELREQEAAIKRQQEAAAASAKAAQAVVIQAPAKLAGVSTGSVLKFEVFDPLALYETHAAFCTIEPNLAAIRTALNSNPSLQLPGVKHWREAKATVRT
jgi:hypothetical protein